MTTKPRHVCGAEVLPSSNGGRVRRCRSRVAAGETRCWLHGGSPGIRSVAHGVAVDNARRDGALTIGDALRLQRERSQHTMGDLARFLGCRVTFVSDIETGKVDRLRAWLDENQAEPTVIDVSPPTAIEEYLRRPGPDVNFTGPDPADVTARTERFRR